MVFLSIYTKIDNSKLFVDENIDILNLLDCVKLLKMEGCLKSSQTFSKLHGQSYDHMCTLFIHDMLCYTKKFDDFGQNLQSRWKWKVTCGHISAALSVQ